MAGELADFPETITPSESDARLAGESSRRLSGLLGTQQEDFRLRVQANDGPEETIAIPASALRLLNDVLTEMAKGNAVTLIPAHAELTTQQAADILNVSRPFFIRLLEEGKIPCRKIGTHRRIRFQDILQYRRQIDEERLKALEELAAQAQELNMGY